MHLVNKISGEHFDLSSWKIAKTSSKLKRTWLNFEDISFLPVSDCVMPLFPFRHCNARGNSVNIVPKETFELGS